MSAYHYVVFVLVLIAILLITVKSGKLTIAGALTGGAIATMIFLGAGYTGTVMLAAFFIVGTIATEWKKNEKQQFKPPGDPPGRSSGQVLANGGVAALAAAAAWMIPVQAGLLKLMMAAGLASAVADTLSSEMGLIYGRRFYNIVTLRKDQRGLDGVISVEGTLIGLAGSALLAGIYALGFGWGDSFLIILAAGTAGNVADSVLGALLERKHYLSNDAVNFLNTLIAAIIAGLCALLR